jgi:hypothetical protein
VVVNIDTAIIWTVFGVLATFVFGAWSLYYAIVGRRYPGRITFIREDCIGLFDSIIRNFPEIIISYQNNPVGQNLVLVKGAFLNTGTKDITEEMAAIPLTVVLPVGYRWLTARVVAASADSAPVIGLSTDKSRLAFDLGLFRCGEYLRFEALAEVPAEETVGKDNSAQRLQRALAFEHRIADTRKVDTTEIVMKASRRRSALQSAFMMSLNVVMSAAMLVWLLFFSNPSLEGNLQFWYAPDKSKSALVTITPRSDGKLHLKGVTEKFDAVVPVETFWVRLLWNDG